jgi:protein TonB
VTPLSSRQRKSREFSLVPPPARPRRALELVVSLALHLLVVLAAVRAGQQLWAPTLAPGAGPGLPGGGGGGGGGGGADASPRMVYILPPPPPEPAVVAVQTPPPEPAVVPPPVPPAPPVRPATDSVPRKPASDSTATGTGAGKGPGEGPGEGPGAGGGTGGGTGGGIGAGKGTGTGPGTGGAGGTITPPVWSAGALPFGQTPKALRGRRIDVTFWVGADGRVAEVAVAPPIADVNYLKYFEQVMLTFRFRPARDPSGAAVPGTVTMGFELPSK